MSLSEPSLSNYVSLAPSSLRAKKAAMPKTPPVASILAQPKVGSRRNSAASSGMRATANLPQASANLTSFPHVGHLLTSPADGLSPLCSKLIEALQYGHFIALLPFDC